MLDSHDHHAGICDSAALSITVQKRGWVPMSRWLVGVTVPHVGVCNHTAQMVAGLCVLLDALLSAIFQYILLLSIIPSSFYHNHTM